MQVRMLTDAMVPLQQPRLLRTLSTACAFDRAGVPTHAAVRDY